MASRIHKHKHKLLHKILCTGLAIWASYIALGVDQAYATDGDTITTSPPSSTSASSQFSSLQPQAFLFNLASYQENLGDSYHISLGYHWIKSIRTSIDINFTESQLTSQIQNLNLDWQQKSISFGLLVNYNYHLSSISDKLYLIIGGGANIANGEFKASTLSDNSMINPNSVHNYYISYPIETGLGFNFINIPLTNIKLALELKISARFRSEKAYNPKNFLQNLIFSKLKELDPAFQEADANNFMNDNIDKNKSLIFDYKPKISLGLALKF